MGQSPSLLLYNAAERGDLRAVADALSAGADLDFRNDKKRSQTPLFTAAKRNRTAVVRDLLQRGALDFRNADGDSALHAAAQRGHAEVVAVLLARGSDHFARNSAGARAIDLAARHGHRGVVRLIEARTCPFFADLELETPSLLPFFAPSWEPRWAVVHRARPHDNPSVDRGDCRLCLFLTRGAATPELELLRPELVPIRSDESGAVVFGLTCDFMLRQGQPLVPPRRVTGRLPRPIYAWLRNVLSTAFSTGRGESFDEFGRVRVPAGAQDYIESVLGPFNWAQGAGSAAASAAVGTTVTASFVALAPAGGAAPLLEAPAAAAALALPAGTLRPAPALRVLSLAPAAAPAAAVAAAPDPQRQALQTPKAAPVSQASPPSASGVVADLLRELDEGRLVFDCDVPEDFVCVITSDLMLDPVVASDGHTYSRGGITHWLSLKRTSPRTNEALPDTRLLPNHHLRAAVLDWVEAHRAAGSVAGQVLTLPVPAPAPATAAPGAAAPARAVAAAPAGRSAVLGDLLAVAAQLEAHVQAQAQTQPQAQTRAPATTLERRSAEGPLPTDFPAAPVARPMLSSPERQQETRQPAAIA